MMNRKDNMRILGLKQEHSSRSIATKMATVLLSMFMLCGCNKTPQEISMADRYFHRYGVEVSKQDFDSRGRTGKIVSHLADGRIGEAHMKEGRLHGQKTLTFPYSEVIEITMDYEEGRLVSKTLHDQKGAPKEKTEFLAEDHQYVRQCWYPGGSPRSKEMWDQGRLMEASYYDLQNQSLSKVESGYGIRTLLNDEGAVTTREEYKGGWLCSQLRFDANTGATLAEIPFVKGIRSGIASFFDSNGELQRTESWQEGELDGEVIEYEKDYPSVIFTYSGGKREGLEYRYRGEMLAETWQWKDDRRHGEHKVYVDEQLVRTDFYYDGVKVSKQGYDQLINEVASH